MNYDDALQRLMSLIDLERTDFSGPRQKNIYDLSRIRHFLEFLGNPHRSIPCLHIAGTKGKGSVSAICESILRASGLRTGFFSSPHLHSFTERLRVDGEPISQEKFTEYFIDMWNKHEEWSHHYNQKLTLFEYITALAFLAFKSERVDVNIIEVGLGGRLDATNVVTPEVSIITAIGYDHTHILGTQIESIAREKAGIIKKGVPVIIGHQLYEIERVIESVARETTSAYIKVADISSYQFRKIENGKQYITVTTPLYRGCLDTALLGYHQAQNILTSITSINELRRQGWEITDSNIEVGVRQVSWPCRLELIEIDSQRIVLDGAHNYDSIKLILDSMKNLFQYDKLGIILGLSKDKDVSGICELIIEHNPEFIHIIKSRHPKSADPDYIYDYFPSDMSNVKIFNKINESVSILRDNLGPDGLILSIGSLFSSAEVREYVLGIEPELYEANV
tara:strand:+ start:12948 stop:14300 length:1353 start_codon:yes stop_codon:yes gene_type:complete